MVVLLCVLAALLIYLASTLWAASLPTVLTFTPSFQGQGYIQNATGGGTQQENLTIGSGGFPLLTPKVTQAAAANGVYQCQQWYQGQFVIASGATTDVDLTALVNGIGGTVDFSGGSTFIKFMMVAIISPDGGTTKSLNVGPQGISNAWVGPFEAGTTNFYLIVGSRAILVDCVEGTGSLLTAVGSTNKVLGLKNTGSASLTCQLFIMG